MSLTFALNHSGYFWCFCNWRCTLLLLLYCWLYHLAPPSFIVRPQDVRTVLNSVVHLPCAIKGNPPPTVFWAKEGLSILMFANNSYGQLLVTNEGTLTINKVQENDNGHYICAGFNVVDSTMERVLLQVSKFTLFLLFLYLVSVIFHIWTCCLSFDMVYCSACLLN